jgi:hypothetical protein
MWPYWLLFLVPAIKAVLEIRQLSKQRSQRRWTFSWSLAFIFLSLMIGLRHEVGGDWSQYLILINEAENDTIAESLVSRDIAFTIVNNLAARSGLGVYLINSIFALIFSWGLLVFCLNQSRPWLALVVAVPYLITVGAMGYSRQGVAIGLVMLGMVALQNKNVWKFLLFVAFAATFHKSAVIMAPLAALAGSRRPILTLLVVCVTTVLLFALLLQEHISSLMSGYVSAQYDSSGAAVRLAMNVVPALIFLTKRKQFQLEPGQLKFWSIMSWGALGFVFLLYISPSSTAVDRLALYWMPLQLFVWSRLPDALSPAGGLKTKLVYAVVCYSGVVYFVWLFFADNVKYWLPYQFYPWVWLWQ